MRDALATMYHAVEAQEFASATRDIERLTGTRAENVREGLARLCGAVRPA